VVLVLSPIYILGLTANVAEIASCVFLQRVGSREPDGLGLPSKEIVGYYCSHLSALAHPSAIPTKITSSTSICQKYYIEKEGEEGLC